MPTVSIKGKEFPYSDSDVITLPEGLIGLPNARQFAIIPMPDLLPFQWFASLDDDRIRFVVVAPQDIFPAFQPQIPEAFSSNSTKTLTIVTVSSDWQKTTVNLKAPIFVDADTRRARQFVLQGAFSLAEALPKD